MVTIPETVTNSVPPTDSDGRLHILDATCWCSPMRITTWDGTWRQIANVRLRHRASR